MATLCTRRIRRPAGPGCANQPRRIARGLAEHTSSATTASLLGTLTSPAPTPEALPEAGYRAGSAYLPVRTFCKATVRPTLDLADDLTEAATALSGLVGMARRASRPFV